MKTTILKITMMILVVGLATACGGGGGDDPFNQLTDAAISSSLVDTWDLEETITETDCPDIIPVGETSSDTIQVTSTGCSGEGDSTDSDISIECQAAGDQVVIVINADVTEDGCHIQDYEVYDLTLDSSSNLNGTFEVTFSASKECSESGEAVNCNLKGTVEGRKSAGGADSSSTSTTSGLRRVGSGQIGKKN